MEHIFIVNPSAGKHNAAADVTQKVESYAAQHTDFSYQIYVTKRPGDATQWVSNYCSQHSGEPVRFYACGGDGTLNEVVTGAMFRPNVEITVHANGSGNDYIKYYGTQHDFNSISNLIEGTPHPVDVMQVTCPQATPRYSINVCNFGFDAQVVRHMETIRRRPIIGGRNAYTTGILMALFSGMRSTISMQTDGKSFFEGSMLLCAMSNGRNYGGNYRCAPHSLNDDGLIEIGLFRPMSVFRLATLIGYYCKGTHLSHPAALRYIIQGQGKEIEIQSPKPIWLSCDGELIHNTHFSIKNLHHALTFVSPKTE